MSSAQAFDLCAGDASQNAPAVPRNCGQVKLPLPDCRKPSARVGPNGRLSLWVSASVKGPGAQFERQVGVEAVSRHRVVAYDATGAVVIAVEEVSGAVKQ